MHATDTELLNEIRALASRAGDAILGVYARDFEVDFKDDSSPLTEADSLAHETIYAGLTQLTPDTPILSEESRPEDLADRLEWPRYWLVDPLDGTKEFIKRNGEFTVNIALVDAHAPVLGVVRAPALGLEFAAAAAAGAWRREDGADAARIACTPAAEPVRVVGSRSHPSGQLAEYLETLGAHELKPMGSSLKICLVAEGRADVYPRFGPTSEWDTAAAQAVLEAAGGRMIDLTGQPLRYNTRSELANPYFLAFGDTSRNWLAGVPT